MQDQTETATLAQQIRAHVSRLTVARGLLTAERSLLESERETLLSAPLNRDDTTALMCEWIDLQAAAWNDSARWANVFHELTYPNRAPMRSLNLRPDVGEVEPVSLRDFDAVVSGDGRASVIGSDGFRFITGMSGHMRLSDGALFALFGDQLKAKYSELFDRFYREPLSIDAQRIGPPIAERRARLEAIAARVGEIAAAVAAIDEQAREVNADLEPARAEAPPPVQQAAPASAGSVVRKYKPGVVQQITGMGHAELLRCTELRPLPVDPDRVGEIFYDAAEVERWMRKHGKSH